MSTFFFLFSLPSFFFFFVPFYSQIRLCVAARIASWRWRRSRSARFVPFSIFFLPNKQVRIYRKSQPPHSLIGGPNVVFIKKNFSFTHTHSLKKKKKTNNKREMPELRETKEEDGWIHKRTFCVIIFWRTRKDEKVSGSSYFFQSFSLVYNFFISFFFFFLNCCCW